MTFAAHQQRERALGRSKDLIPFAFPVHVRSKFLAQAASTTLTRAGKMMYISGQRMSFTRAMLCGFQMGTSLRIRPNTVDADDIAPLHPVEASSPVPARRVRKNEPVC